MPYRRNTRAIRLGAQAIELAFASPQVVMHRLTRVALAGASPSLSDQQEFHRMGAEKVAAFHESWHAMLGELFRMNLALWSSPWRWAATSTSGLHALRLASRHAERTTLAVLGAGIAPVHRRAVANARRLRRPRC
jgi:hypothetical protein